MTPKTNIRALRDLRGLNQEDLAAATGLSQSTLSRAEALDGGVTIRNFLAIAKALNCSLADLFSTDRSEREAALVNAYRSLPSERRAGWDDIVLGALAQNHRSSESLLQELGQSAAEEQP